MIRSCLQFLFSFFLWNPVGFFIQNVGRIVEFSLGCLGGVALKFGNFVIFWGNEARLKGNTWGRSLRNVEKRKYPIVLAHGVTPFDLVRLNPEGYYWYEGTRCELEDAGFDVFITRVEWAGSVESRGEQLAQKIKRIIQKTGCKKVHLLAHSMGGLDSRQAIVRGGLAPYVASLITIGTPHLGSPVADSLVDKDYDAKEIAINVLIEFLDRCRISSDGLNSLTSKDCERRNRALEEDERKYKEEYNILYRFYGGKQTRNNVLSVMRPGYDIIEKRVAKENDGLVPVDSALWEGCPFFEADKEKCIKNLDHLNLLGWYDVSDGLLWLTDFFFYWVFFSFPFLSFLLLSFPFLSFP